jgi:predicted nucleic acid-binding protein
LEADARGNLAFDAQMVAACKEHRVSTLLSLDRDFSRFSGLTLLSPLDPPPAPEPLPE